MYVICVNGALVRHEIGRPVTVCLIGILTQTESGWDSSHPWVIKPHQNTESCFRHPIFDLRETRKVEIRHTNLHFSGKKVTSLKFLT